MVCWYGAKNGVRFTVTVCQTPLGTVFGIYARWNGEEAYVTDISPDKADVRRLARACVRVQLEPCHLRDAAEDWLADIK